METSIKCIAEIELLNEALDAIIAELYATTKERDELKAKAEQANTPLSIPGPAPDTLPGKLLAIWNGSMTAREAHAQVVGYELESVRGAIPQLVKAGKLMQAGKRECSVGGRVTTVWVRKNGYAWDKSNQEAHHG